MSVISKQRLQAIKDVFYRMWTARYRRVEPAWDRLAHELKEVFPPVTFGAGAPFTATDSYSQAGDLYIDRNTGAVYIYVIPSGWQAIAGGGGGGGAVTIQDEGVNQGVASTIDFVGPGVTATVSAGVATINITGGGGSSTSFSLAQDGMGDAAYQYMETVGGVFPTSYIWYSGANNTTPKVYEKVVTRDAQQRASDITWMLYNPAGTLAATVFDVITYTSGVESSRTRTLTIVSAISSTSNLEDVGEPQSIYGYRAVTGSPFTANVTWYTNNTMVTKVYEEIYTRNAEQRATQIQWIFYTGGIATTTVTDTITYSGGVEASRARSVV
jgi:hypothetical protein